MDEFIKALPGLLTAVGALLAAYYAYKLKLIGIENLKSSGVSSERLNELS